MQEGAQGHCLEIKSDDRKISHLGVHCSWRIHCEVDLPKAVDFFPMLCVCVRFGDAWVCPQQPLPRWWGIFGLAWVG